MPGVNAALTSLVGIGGLVVGALLDPVGQRMAERSRIEEEARRREREERKDAARAEHAVRGDQSGEGTNGEGTNDEGTNGEGTNGEGTNQPTWSEAPAAAAHASAPPAPGAAMRHLVPAGRSVPRTVAAAVATGGLWAGSAVRFGAHTVLGAYLVFFALLVAVALTDLSTRLVPRRLVYPCAGLMVVFFLIAAAVDHATSHLSGAAIGGAVAFGAFFVVWWFVPRGMGFGDVRLAGVIGIATGWLSLLHAYAAFFVGFIAGLVFGLVAIAASGGGRRTRIPFAPALAVGAVVGVFWGGPMVRAVFGAGA